MVSNTELAVQLDKVGPQFDNVTGDHISSYTVIQYTVNIKCRWRYIT